MNTCLSTHGAAGYAPGSRKVGDVVICGLCGARIENPRPLGFRYIEYTWREASSSWRAFYRAVILREPKTVEPVWPE